MSDTRATAGTADAARAELLARRLAGRATGGGRPGIEPVDRSGPLALSSGQEQMWFLNRLDPTSHEYLVPVALRIRGALDAAALAAAWRAVVARHEILRTRYRLVAGEPVQVVDPVGADAAAELRLAELTEDEAAGLVERETTTPFDLEREWPARATLVRIAAGEHLLVAVFHHIACDAWSIEIFATELAELYRAELAGEPASLPALPVQYADYASWERGQAAGEHERHLDYWQRRLAGLTPLELPTDRPRPARRRWDGDVLARDLPGELGTRLRELARAHDTTLFTVLLTAFQVLLARYTGGTDIPVGTIVSGRNRPELQRLIGYGVNSLVLRAVWAGDPPFHELLAGARATVAEAFDHQNVPFARLADRLAPERDLSRTPLFQVVFTVQEARSDLFGLPGLDVRAVPSASRVSRFDLTLLVEESADGALRANLEYATALFNRSTVDRLAGNYVRLLEAVAADPGARVATVPFLGPDELAGLVGPQPRQVDVASVPELFQRQVSADPGAVAVSYRDQSLSYAELNARANQLAHYLRGRGVGRGSLVGVCFDRGLDLAVTLLGVLKSGAAYVPLDPAAPRDRLAFVLADCGASAVVVGAEQAGVVRPVRRDPRRAWGFWWRASRCGGGSAGG